MRTIRLDELKQKNELFDPRTLSANTAVNKNTIFPIFLQSQRRETAAPNIGRELNSSSVPPKPFISISGNMIL